jgi:hypothetical protein
VVKATRTIALLLLLGTGSVACGSPRDRPEEPDARVVPPAAPLDPPTAQARAPTPTREPSTPLGAGQTITIPAGIVRLGSRPGSSGRDPRREADLVSVDLPSFTIDRLPYPNDPAERPRTGVSRDEASALCAADGKRLCTELEWERACKADTELDYPGGHEDLETCMLDSAACASPFDVLSLGVEVFEWTASDVTRGLGSARYSAVVRGGRASDPVAEHRCGARHALDPAAGDRDTGFRCCGGPTSDVAYPDEGGRRAFRDREIEVTELRRVLATVPELARFASDFSLFTPEDVDRALAKGSVTREQVSWTLVTHVLVWSPEHGEEAWVVAGAGGGSSLVAILHPLPDGTFVHGSSFVLAGEPEPIALAWDIGQRRQILWSASWNTPFEGGVIEARDDHRIVIVQR